MKKKEKEQKSNFSVLKSSRLSKKGFISIPDRLKHLIHLSLENIKLAFHLLRMGLRPVKATLKLSPEALNTPLPPGWLNNIREFLTRTGKWKEHPIHSIEHVIITPAPGVVDEIPRPVIITPGFGEINFKPDLWECPKNVCPALDLTGLISGGLHCYVFLCWEVDCSYYDPSGCYFQCDFGGCKHGQCPDLEDECPGLCGEYDEEEGFHAIPEFEAYWDHPFVKELRNYFGVDSVDKLFNDVKHYIGRNMYDESASHF